jgi:hypothetical protein
LLIVRPCPTRHSCKPHATANDVAKLTVRKTLCQRQSQIGDFGI